MQKGLGRARIHWPLSDGSRLKIDFFTTHLVSYTNNPNRDNNFVRYMQTLETVKYIDKTDADVKIFAGDLPFHEKRKKSSANQDFCSALVLFAPCNVY